MEEIRERNTQNHVKYEPQDDFKYRFRRADKLRPVCNLKLYWGKDGENLPVSLKDMMDIEAVPEQMRFLINDYRVHTVWMRAIADEDLQKMQSDMKYVVGVLKRTERREWICAERYMRLSKTQRKERRQTGRTV